MFAKDLCKWKFSFPCDESGEDFCAGKTDQCNGIPQCPHAEDEDFEMCSKQGVFSPLATIECLRPNTYNVNISIYAVKCDGIVECALGEDEEDCQPPNSAYYIFATTLFLILFIVALVILVTIKQLNPITEEQKLLKGDIEKLHQTQALKTALWQTQNCAHQSTILEQLTDMEMQMSEHNGSISEVICCMKVFIRVV